MARVARFAVHGGADILQLRAKKLPFKMALRLAKTIQGIARRHNALFIINDRIDIAASIACDGLHIGQGDIDISLARKLLHKETIVGVSVKNISQALLAKGSGADYLGIGPVFKTPIKADTRPRGVGLLKAVKHLGIPSFAIGGINIKNIQQLVRQGVTKVAVIRAVCAAADPYREAKRLKDILKR